MKHEANEPREEQPSSLSLIEVLNIASTGYPDEYLGVYYNEATGKFNEAIEDLEGVIKSVEAA